MRLFTIVAGIDAWLLRAPRRIQIVAIAVTSLVIAVVGLHNVPRSYIDFRTVPVLNRVSQPEGYGPDTIGDRYEARVVLNDPFDMYTKRRVEQTALEAATWSKEASAPYPAAMLLVEGLLLAVGQATGIGFYGSITALALMFLALSAYYFLKTRWYLFPLLYLNFSYLGTRLFYVQDNSYLIMLTVVMAALFAASRRPAWTHVLMSVAITLKLSPVYYLANLTSAPRRLALLCLAIVIAGLVLPMAIWDNYLYIFQFHQGLKGSTSRTVGAVLISVPFALTVRYVETRLNFDAEERVGWGLIPFSLFLAFKMNTARHLLLPLLVPDKRGARNVVAAVALILPVMFPGIVRLNPAVLAGLLLIALVYYLDLIGWAVVRADLRRPIATMRMMFATGWTSSTASDRRA